MKGADPTAGKFYVASEREEFEELVERAFGDKPWIKFSFFSKSGPPTALPPRCRR